MNKTETPKIIKEDLTGRIIKLFQPQEKGIALTFRSIANNLGIKGKNQLEFYCWKGVKELTAKKVLYERKTQFIWGIYMLNPEHLWDEKFQKKYSLTQISSQKIQQQETPR